MSHSLQARRILPGCTCVREYFQPSSNIIALLLEMTETRDDPFGHTSSQEAMQPMQPSINHGQVNKQDNERE